ncbi:MAG TPA: phytanoyl-CoA dioxygenase family protein [Anaerolineae bacterium]
MTIHTTTPEHIQQFNDDGFIIMRGLFDTEEMELLIKKSKADAGLQEDAYGRLDAGGNTIKLALWNDPKDDLYGMVSRCRRIVDSMEAFLGGEVYHYHSKMILKEPHVGGAWEWHQDYGYWYNNGCLFPTMASCMIAVDRATQENGCLQVLKGSHHLGRIEHGVVADQTGADMERVRAAMERLDLVHCEMDPGDAVFFHANLLHASAPNKSDNPRWALICCYNTARNDPYKDGPHPRYTPLQKVDDSMIKEVGRAEVRV